MHKLDNQSLNFINECSKLEGLIRTAEVAEYMGKWIRHQERKTTSLKGLPAMSFHPENQILFLIVELLPFDERCMTELANTQ